VKEGGTVNNMTNITSCCERMAAPGGLCAPACSLQGAEVLGCGGYVRAKEPGFDFGRPALQKAVAVNGLSNPVTASSLSEPK